MDLAAQVKRLEDSAAAVRENNRAALLACSDQLDVAIDRQGADFKKTAQAKQSTCDWRRGTRAAIERQNAAMRADFKKRQAEDKRTSVEWAAGEAENDAMVA